MHSLCFAVCVVECPIRLHRTLSHASNLESRIIVNQVRNQLEPQSHLCIFNEKLYSNRTLPQLHPHRFFMTYRYVFVYIFFSICSCVFPMQCMKSLLISWSTPLSHNTFQIRSSIGFYQWIFCI